MTLKPVAFKKDIKHTNLSVQTSRPLAPRASIKKPLKINFSDSESDDPMNNPIPYLKGSSSSESLSEEDYDPNVKPTNIRKGLRRPMPINRGTPKKVIQKQSPRNSTKIRKESVPNDSNNKFLPRPPISTKTQDPQAKDDKSKKVSPMFFRRVKKNGSGDENVNNWIAPQKEISLVKPKVVPDNSYSYSEDEQSYNISNDYYSEEYENDQIDSSEFSPSKESENKESPTTETNKANEENKTNSVDNTNTFNDSNSIPENSDTVNKITNQINDILNSNTKNEENIQNQDSIPLTHEEEQPIKDDQEEIPQSICYFIDRKVISKFPKNRLCITLTKGCYSVISQVFDIRDESFQITFKNQLYTILLENSYCSFSLHKGESYDDEIFSILYNTTKNAIKPKNCVLHFFTEVQGLPNRIQSVKPNQNSEGESIIRFGHRQVIPSIKNMKFLDENQKEILAVMKIGKDQICIEASSLFPEEVIYLFGVAAFLNHSKLLIFLW